MTEWTKDKIAELRRVCDAAGMDGDDELSARLEFDDYGRSQYVVENDDETIRVYPYEYRKHGETGSHREDYCLANYVAPAMSKFPAALDEIERCHALLARIRQHAHRLPPDIEAELGAK